MATGERETRRNRGRERRRWRKRRWGERRIASSHLATEQPTHARTHRRTLFFTYSPSIFSIKKNRPLEASRRACRHRPSPPPWPFRSPVVPPSTWHIKASQDLPRRRDKAHQVYHAWMRFPHAARAPDHSGPGRLQDPWASLPRAAASYRVHGSVLQQRPSPTRVVTGPRWPRTGSGGKLHLPNHRATRPRSDTHPHRTTHPHHHRHAHAPCRAARSDHACVRCACFHGKGRPSNWCAMQNPISPLSKILWPLRAAGM